ncbi:MAG: hypothetical protein U0Y82_05585 [Thermoleophilia bacterium]
MLPLAAEWRPQTPRTDLIRCTLTDAGLSPAQRQSSQDITSLAAATHIAAVPPGSDTLRPGDAVPALALPDGA